MFSQDFPCLQIHSGEVTSGFDDLATNFFVPVAYDDHILIGNIAYDFLAREANSGQYSSGFLGYPSLLEDTHCIADLPTFSFPSADSSTFPTTTYNSLFFPPYPSPPPSQSSSTSKCRQASPESPSAPKPSCRQATPMFNHIRRKWCCSVCNKCFRGKWECKRHIGVTGKRAKCLVCEGVLSGREDSLRRHFKKYCRGNVRSLKFEDAFIEV